MRTVELLTIIMALVAALNPPSLSVITMSVASLLGNGKHPRHAGLHSLFFSLGILASYSVIAACFSLLVWFLPVAISGYIGLALGVLIILFGLLEVKDYFWYGKGLSFKLSKNAETRIHTWTKKHHNHARGFLLGIYTSLRLSHYTLILLFSSIFLGSFSAPDERFLGLVWAAAYTLPLACISILIFFGVNAHSLTSWKEQTKHTMRLSIGLIYILMGYLILVTMAGGLKLV